MCELKYRYADDECDDNNVEYLSTEKDNYCVQMYPWIQSLREREREKEFVCGV